MEIELRDYNKRTLDNLYELLDRYKRVSINQPPSTCKSIITLKYIKDNLLNNKLNRVLYITSWKVAATEVEKKIEKYDIDKDKMDVVTYSTIRSDSFLDEIKNKNYDLIVIDEYQHAGAFITSQKLNILFNMFKDAKIIGTSATPIRYLDNQKDMSQIIFNGIKASNMSVEEGLIRGILPELEYYTALDNNELIDKIVNNYPLLLESNNKEIQDLLEKLRDFKTNNSKGIRNIIKENIKPGEKYVVYFKDLKQMELFRQGIKDGSIDWFSDIDTSPNIYELYYKNSDDENEKNYTDFINENNGHVSLLLNINMATEVLHFVNKNNDEMVINGNIILRDTNSPNLFIQMIGRSFTAKHPKIFDFVANIYKDYSIYSFKNELQSANKSYKKGSQIKIVDQVIQIETILNRLNKILRETDWEIEYKNILNNGLKNYISTDFIKELIENDDRYLDIIVHREEKEWLVKQYEDFYTGVLPVYKIEKLKILGLFEEEERFNTEDLKTIDLYFKNIDSTRIYKEDFKNNDWHLKIAKYFVMNYYYRKKEQDYDLADYINDIIVWAINYVNEHDINDINVNALKQHILNNIKNKQKNKRNDIDIEFLEDSNDTYDFENVISNIESKDDLTLRLFYLYMHYPKQYNSISDYYGLKFINNQLVSTAPMNLTEISKNRGLNKETIRQHILKGTRLLKRHKYDVKDYKSFINLEDYVTELIKETQNNKNTIVNLFKNEIYDEDAIGEINKIINTTKNQIILKNKENIKSFISKVEDKYFNNIEDYKIKIIKSVSKKNRLIVKEFFSNNIYSAIAVKCINDVLLKTSNKAILIHKDDIINYVNGFEQNYFNNLDKYIIYLIKSYPVSKQDDIIKFFKEESFDFDIYSLLIKKFDRSNDQIIIDNKNKIINKIESIKNKYQKKYFQNVEDYILEFIGIFQPSKRNQIAKYLIEEKFDYNTYESLIRKIKYNYNNNSIINKYKNKLMKRIFAVKEKYEKSVNEEKEKIY